MTVQPTVFVVDDDETLRDSLCWLLQSMKMSVRAFASARDFLSACDASQPGCLLLDVRMPEISGLQLQQMMAARGIRLPVIFITGHGDVAMAVRAMKQGASDFLQKPFNDQVLLERVQQCIELDTEMRRKAAEHDRIAGRAGSLTQRESEVLDGVLAGRSNKQIAADLGISVKTVEVHRARMMEKMQAATVGQLAAQCVVAGLYRAKP
jgi:FixJ family two-component response regulator